MTSNTKTQKFNISRANDFMYDPNFIVPTQKDHEKYAHKASIASAQIEIAPVFENMFSELTNCPRQTIVMKVIPEISHFRRTNLHGSAQSLLLGSHTMDISGANRAIFCKMPIVTLSSQLLVNKLILPSKKEPPKIVPKPFQTKGVQTKYRESSAQTSPWKPEKYIITDGSDPEILKLHFLKENLPPGMHEVEIIKHARRQRNWEKILPDVDTEANIIKRRQILEAIEMDKWTFREYEIAMIQDLRLELLEHMLQELLDSGKSRSTNKLQRLATRVEKEHETNMKKLRHRTNREIRLLYRQTKGISTKYKKVNVIDEYMDYKSEAYAPLMRHGEHPKRKHAKICLEYESPLYNVEALSTLPRWLGSEYKIKEKDIKLPGRRLCIRETKWTEPVLKQMHAELLNLNKVIKMKCTLREPRVKPKALDETIYLTVSKADAIAEIEDEAALILQCIIRGRSTQTLLYEGRDRCRELIEELQSTHFIDLSQRKEMHRRRMEVLKQQRNRSLLTEREKHLEQALNKLQGSVVGTMLNFLSNELVRIRDERKAHALALLYERERRDREAAEAGRRQLEERRRQEHDEVFKQMLKVHQDTIDLYLQDIITEGIDHATKEEAEKYVKKLATQVAEESKEPPRTFTDKEELIANMVCHFLLPEAEKQRIRGKFKKRQQKYLRCAHEAIFNKLENLPNYKDEEQNLCASIEKFKLPSMETSEKSSQEIPEEEIEQSSTEIESSSTEPFFADIWKMQCEEELPKSEQMSYEELVQYQIDEELELKFQDGEEEEEVEQEDN